MTNDVINVRYQLPRTLVRVAADVTTKTDLRTGKEVQSSTANVELVTEADPGADMTLTLADSKLKDMNVSLVFSDDGRLLSTERESIGRLGEVVRTGVQIVTTVAATALSIARGGKFSVARQEDAAEREQPRDVEALYAEKHPELAARRRELRDATNALLKRQGEIAGQVDDAADVGDFTNVWKSLEALQKSLQVVRKEQDLLEQHFSIWKTTAEGEETKSFEFDFEIDELVRSNDELPESWDAADLPGGGKARRAYDATGVLVAVVDRERDQTYDPDKKSGSVYFRYPRRVELGVYVRSGSEPQAKAELTKRIVAPVVDDYSQLESIRLGESAWARNSSALTFGPNGTVEKLSNQSESPLAAAAAAVGEIPADIAASLERANKILEQERKLATAGIDRRVAELEQRKKLLEVDIAHAGLSNTKSERIELDRIKQQIDLLKNKKELRGLEAELEPAGETS